MRFEPTRIIVSIRLKVVCPVESAVPWGCGGSQPVYADATGSQPGRPFAPVKLRLSRRSVAEGKMMSVIEWGGHRGRTTDFLAFTLRLRKTPENLRKPSGVLCRVTSHCFKWGPFPPNEVGRVTLPAPLAKPIGPSQNSVLKNLRSGIRRFRKSGPPFQTLLSIKRPTVTS